MAQLAKHALFGAAVMAATGAPYAMHTVSDAIEARGGAGNLFGSSFTAGLSGFDGQSGAVSVTSTEPVEGPPIADVAEILSFDISPAWVQSRWPRVLATWGGPNLQIYRVPVTTGVAPRDLAGSLSYHFDTSGQLQKIEFKGVTGDARPLVSHLTQRHGFIPVATGNPGLRQYQVQSSGFAMSQLTVRMGHVLEAERPHGSQNLELILRRPVESRWFSQAKPSLDAVRWP